MTSTKRYCATVDTCSSGHFSLMSSGKWALPNQIDCYLLICAPKKGSRHEFEIYVNEEYRFGLPVCGSVGYRTGADLGEIECPWPDNHCLVPFDDRAAVFPHWLLARFVLRAIWIGTAVADVS